MLKSWSIKNFKPIVDSGELELAPVTILAGRNSSGKSSLLQSILMIAQTLGSRLVDRPLLPNEWLVQLGTLENILSEFSDSRILQLTFKLTWNKEDHTEKNTDSLALDEISEEVYITVSFRAINDKDNINASEVIVEQACIRAKSFSEMSASPEESWLEEGELAFSFLNTDGDVPNHSTKTTPYRLRDPFIYAGTFKSEDKKISSDAFLHLSHFLPTSFMPRPFSAEPLQNNDQWKRLIYNAVVHTTNFFITQIRYLSPSRVDPGMVQQHFAPTSELDNVGTKGEYSAIVYHSNKKNLIDWYNPQTQRVENATLQVALDTWAQYLKIAEHISTEKAGAIGITWQIVIKAGQKARLLFEVGTSVSQIIPILVIGLLSPTNSLLIIEQPELHLHPFALARLGDFFMGLAKCKKQCLLETHSENLVSQLRLHIVQAGGLEASGCMIYFVDQDEEGAAKFEKIRISERGNILNWPEGFFDEAMIQEDKITAASLRRRAKLTKQDSGEFTSKDKMNEA